VNSGIGAFFVKSFFFVPASFFADPFYASWILNEEEQYFLYRLLFIIFS